MKNSIALEEREPNVLLADYPDSSVKGISPEELFRRIEKKVKAIYEM